MPRGQRSIVSEPLEPLGPLPAEFEALVRLHPPRAIRDEAEYSNMQELIDRLTSLVGPSEGQSEYLETLSILFEAYEAEHHELDPAAAGPAEMLQFLLEQRGESAAEVDRALGGSAAADLVAGRELGTAAVRSLAEHFHVRPDLLL